MNEEQISLLLLRTLLGVPWGPEQLHSPLSGHPGVYPDLELQVF
jgi:hypothetical protein